MTEIRNLFYMPLAHFVTERQYIAPSYVARVSGGINSESIMYIMRNMFTKMLAKYGFKGTVHKARGGRTLRSRCTYEVTFDQAPAAAIGMLRIFSVELRDSVPIHFNNLYYEFCIQKRNFEINNHRLGNLIEVCSNMNQIKFYYDYIEDTDMTLKALEFFEYTFDCLSRINRIYEEQNGRAA